MIVQGGSYSSLRLKALRGKMARTGKYFMSEPAPFAPLPPNQTKNKTIHMQQRRKRRAAGQGQIYLEYQVTPTNSQESYQFNLPRISLAQSVRTSCKTRRLTRMCFVTSGRCGISVSWTVTGWRNTVRSRAGTVGKLQSPKQRSRPLGRPHLYQQLGRQFRQLTPQ